jgi:UPF0716 family protein affecting phage T7 exclusion
MFFIPLPLVLIEVLIFSTFVHFYNFWDVFFCYLFPSFLGILLFSRMSKGLVQGEMPADKMLHRGAFVIGSILLIIPLFLSRVLALFLILPIFRHASIFIFKTFLFKHLAKYLSKSQFSFVRFGRGAGGFGSRPQGPFPFEQDASTEREAKVVDVTPLEITHTKIEEEATRKRDPSLED